MSGIVGAGPRGRHAVLGERREQPVPSAETLVAALGGVLLAARLKPPRQRRAFARASLDQLLSAIEHNG